MLELLLDLDIKVFLFLNGMHAPWLDVLMYWITNKYIWIPLYIFFIVIISLRNGWKGISGIILIVIAIGLADHITSGIMKPYFERLRPCHNPEIANLVHLVTRCGGKYGFASSHAANSFALASSLFFIYKVQFKYLGWMFLCSLVIAYSRIYVGVHYPLDIITGGAIGVFLGLLMLLIYNWLPNKVKPANPE